MIIAIGSTLLLPIDEMRSTLPGLKSKGNIISFLLTAWVLIYEMRVLHLVLAARRTPNQEAAFVPSQTHNMSTKGIFNALPNWEKRFWLYALMVKTPKMEVLTGTNHFGTGKQNGNASAWLGWAIVNLVPTPIIHVLLHQKSTLAAGLSTLACLMSSLWLWAEYRAAMVRPVSIDGNFLYLRYGLLTDRKIDRGGIFSAKAVSYLDSLQGAHRYAGFGAPNVLLKLKGGEELALGVDDPARFIETLNIRKAEED